MDRKVCLMYRLNVQLARDRNIVADTEQSDITIFHSN